MAKKNFYKVRNGDMFVDEWDTRCDDCGCFIHESYPHEEDETLVLCGDCAFKRGWINGDEYVKHHMFSVCSIKRAAVRDGVIYVTDKAFPWEKTKRQQRHDAGYVEWRTKVFERDGFKCAICGQVGGTLNAHHIKTFKDFPGLRLDIDNGITLCQECHKRVHKEKNSEWLYIGEQVDSEKLNMDKTADLL